MAKLRDLLDKYDQVTQTDIDSGAVRVSQYAGETLTLIAYCNGFDCHSGCCDAYNRGTVCGWCVPAGVSEVEFHVWGGGGGGAGSRGCHGGLPGWSGAYAKKTVTGVSEGDCYLLCAGHGGKCSRCDFQAPARGCDGCCSFVIGTGLTNFCADGGYGGVGCCQCLWQTCCGSGPLGEGWIYFNDYESCCTQYYGADCGAYGIPGFLMHYCCCQDNSCWWKVAVPYPGGLFSKEGGHSMVRMQGNACRNHFAQCAAIGLGSGALQHTPGMGAMSSNTCGDGSCDAMGGGPGMVKVVYR